ncbi:hypothetical protein PoB_003624800 [Plakobranchus ocellatus]|uniref:Uncharacterized protein n=1 Tax=Plakobranchus ocellatus TaxID=259542 RepID=A0AAV4AQW1_9GAST|nr:hypothetical protein PoB_003624800 [Plakobranchus ocellatus]
MNKIDDILRHSLCERSLEGKLKIKRLGLEPLARTLSLNSARGIPVPSEPLLIGIMPNQCSHPRAAVGKSKEVDRPALRMHFNSDWIQNCSHGG